jgi:hypothetical protein
VRAWGSRQVHVLVGLVELAIGARPCRNASPEKAAKECSILLSRLIISCSFATIVPRRRYFLPHGRAIGPVWRGCGGMKIGKMNYIDLNDTSGRLPTILTRFREIG